MSKVVTLDATLEREGQSTPVKIVCRIKAITAESGTVHIKDIVENLVGLAPGQRVPDANDYLLKYALEGQPQPPQKYRVIGGELRAGW